MTRMGHMQLELDFGMVSDAKDPPDRLISAMQQPIDRHEAAQVIDFRRSIVRRCTSDASELYESILASVRHIA